ncbi:MAG TPA: putative lipid II flippase FtsW [Candidatus Binatia bacterium]|nr:putative lipid II flippase FtsW [Candidatus Binatia bacterium]
MIAQPEPLRAPYAIATQRPRVVLTRSLDGWILGAALLLLGLGLVMVFDASFFIGQERYGNPYALVRRHVAFLVAGLALAALVLRIDARRLERWAYPAALLAIALVALSVIPGIGQVRGGARRWLSLGILAFEPSELLKPAFVLYLARSLVRKRERLDDFAYGVLPHLVVAAVPIALLLVQPDFGAAMVIGVLTIGMLFAAGARPLHLGALSAAALPGVFALVWWKPYRWARLVAFLDPWSDAERGGFQLVQSLIAFGSGGLLGVGLGNGKQKLFYLPEGHTDFIFALVGEELGLAGAIAVLVCFAVIGLRGFRVAARLTDPFARLVAFGLTFLLVTQATMNVGVVLGLLPTKGLPLPLVSYGGSSMLATVATVAMLVGLSREAR